MTTAPDPPAMRPGNLALRFVVELSALVGLGVGGWALGGGLGVAGAATFPLAAMAAWGTFAVPDDPSRSGGAPVPVPGVVRLLVEAVVIGGGCVGWATGGLPVVATVLAVLTVVHYGIAWPRLTWLVAVR